MGPKLAKKEPTIDLALGVITRAPGLHSRQIAERIGASIQLTQSALCELTRQGRVTRLKDDSHLVSTWAYYPTEMKS